jgi:hypothetical protein
VLVTIMLMGGGELAARPLDAGLAGSEHMVLSYNAQRDSSLDRLPRAHRSRREPPRRRLELPRGMAQRQREHEEGAEERGADEPVPEPEPRPRLGGQRAVEPRVGDRLLIAGERQPTASM